jgi:SpoVK/Ycf46/Vps4 family AAA+-type ATPase
VLASQLQGQVSFHQAKGSDVVGKWVGESAQRVRRLFERARAQTPAIIFIDEIDTLLARRGSDDNAERQSVVTEFLQQLDGLDSTPGVFVLGATNVPERLDPAATRPGRLGRKIAIPLPTLDNRRALFELHLRDARTQDDVVAAELAEHTEGASGADVESICAQAAERAFIRQSGPRAVTREDLTFAVARWRETSAGAALLLGA